MNRDDIPGVREADTLADGAETIARATWEATLLTAVELLRQAGIDHGWYSAQRYLTDMAKADPVWLTPGEDHTDVRLVHDVGGKTRIGVPAPMDKGSRVGPCAYCGVELEIAALGAALPALDPDTQLTCYYCAAPIAPTGTDDRYVDEHGRLNCPNGPGRYAHQPAGRRTTCPARVPTGPHMPYRDRPGAPVPAVPDELRRG
jgi:hypothetical protein